MVGNDTRSASVCDFPHLEDAEDQDNGGRPPKQLGARRRRKRRWVNLKKENLITRSLDTKRLK